MSISPISSVLWVLELSVDKVLVQNVALAAGFVYVFFYVEATGVCVW